MSIVEAIVAELEADPKLCARLSQLLTPEAPATTPAVYTTATLAAEVGRSPKAIRAAIRRGDLHATRSGKGYVIAADEVARWATPPAPAATRTRRRPAAQRPGVMAAALDRSRKGQ